MIRFLKKIKYAKVFILGCFVVVICFSATISFASSTSLKTSSSVEEKGIYTVSTSTVTDQEGGNNYVKVTKFIKNNETGEVIRDRKTDYENKAEGICVSGDTLRKNVEGKEVVTGSVEGWFDTTCYIKNYKKTSYNCKIRDEIAKKIISYIGAQKLAEEKDAQLDMTAGFSANLPELSLFTAIIPYTVLSKFDKEEYKTKVSMPDVYITFKDPARELINENKKNLGVSLEKLNDNELRGVRVKLSEGVSDSASEIKSVELGITYEQEFGYYPEGIEVFIQEADGSRRKITEGVSYDLKEKILKVQTKMTEDITVIVCKKGTMTEKKSKIKIVPSIPVVTTQDKTFDDIRNHKNKVAIEAMAERKIINGMNDSQFAPNKTMNRSEFATIVVKALGIEVSKSGRFKDVKAGSWYAGYVDTANRVGIVNGKSATEFDPKGTITKEEAAVMVTRAAGLCGINTKYDNSKVAECMNEFTDSSSCSSWAKAPLVFCYDSKIFSLKEKQIQPKTAIKRCEIAQMLYNMLCEAELI